MRRFASRVLRREGFDVVEATDGVEALEVVQSQGFSFAVVVSDIVMPHMNGLDFLRTLRADPRWQGVNFIAMSGTINSKAEALEAGANHYLVKPFSFHELYALLAQG